MGLDAKTFLVGSVDDGGVGSCDSVRREGGVEIEMDSIRSSPKMSFCVSTWGFTPVKPLDPEACRD
jgi:hypothetical protein